MLWQNGGGWGHAVSPDMARWTRLGKKVLAVAGPNAWDGSLTLDAAVNNGAPVALFDCTAPSRDRVGHNHSCSGLPVSPSPSPSLSSPQSPPSSNNSAGIVGIGDPSYIGIARPVDLNDPNLTATCKHSYHSESGDVNILQHAISFEAHAAYIMTLAFNVY